MAPTTIEVTVDLGPERLAAMFCEMDSEQQAEFFRTVQGTMAGWKGIAGEMQLAYIGEEMQGPRDEGLRDWLGSLLYSANGGETEAERRRTKTARFAQSYGMGPEKMLAALSAPIPAGDPVFVDTDEIQRLKKRFEIGTPLAYKRSGDLFGFVLAFDDRPGIGCIVTIRDAINPAKETRLAAEHLDELFVPLSELRRPTNPCGEITIGRIDDICDDGSFEVTLGQLRPEGEPIKAVTDDRAIDVIKRSKSDFRNALLGELRPIGSPIGDPEPCPDCKGTGIYEGFTAVEDCRTCGGSGKR